jgi:hypothetical protein
VRFGFLAEQPDHRADPKPNLTCNAADTEPLGPQVQRCLHLPGVALLDRAAAQLFPIRFVEHVANLSNSDAPARTSPRRRVGPMLT